MRRLASGMLWGGLLLFVLGVVSCGVGCVTTAASVAGGSSPGFVAGGGLGVLGLTALILCVTLMVAGSGMIFFLNLMGHGKKR